MRITGFKEGHFLVTYLEAPLVDGRLKACHLEPFVAKVGAKVAGWKAKLLSQKGETYRINACSY